MSVDFRQLQSQVREMGDLVSARDALRRSAQSKAAELLSTWSEDIDRLRTKAAQAAEFDPYLRCALPVSEPLAGSFGLPETPAEAVVIAADGSQINPDRHAEVEFSLINVGTIQLRYGARQAPTEHLFSELLFDDHLFTADGMITEGMLALKRDLSERRALLTLSQEAAAAPVITFTDGPIELWTRREQVDAAAYRKSFDEYLDVLRSLGNLDAATAGYVDRPGANYTVRLLEVGLLEDDRLRDLRSHPPLGGASDRSLFGGVLPPGCRSAVFGLQSPSAGEYEGDLKLHFFYLNVGRVEDPKIARVEIPSWVARDPRLLNPLHAVLVDQTQALGARAYPYLLHRAHEAALVTIPDKDQIVQMILLELQRRGMPVNGLSEKQFLKNLPGRERYRGG